MSSTKSRENKPILPREACSRSTLRPGTPLALFQTRTAGVSGGFNRPQYDVAADGRFLIYHSLEDTASPITVILNWKPK